MKVKMLTCLSGVDYTVNAGDTHECSADEAERLIAAGFAEAVEPSTNVQAAKSTGKPKTETADKLITGTEQRG